MTLELRNDVELPDNAIAEIRQTSLLGEKFVSLGAPETGASSNALADGDVIPLERTGRNPEVEEVLGALSLLLNGGGVAQLKTITSELNHALEGREGTAKSVLRQIEAADDPARREQGRHRGRDRGAQPARGRGQPSTPTTIDAALEELPERARLAGPAARRPGAGCWRRSTELGGVGVRVIQASKAATIDAFRSSTRC